MRKPEEKKILRAKLLAKRLRLNSNQVTKLSGEIIHRLAELVDWNEIQNIHIYLPIRKNNEIDTTLLLEFIQKHYPKINIHVPKNDGFTEFYKDSKIHFNSLGIPEPESKEISGQSNFDLIILPVVGFDRRGYRLGYGGGYYDKFLVKHICKQIIGLAYSFSQVDKISNEPHDKKMHKIITENEIFDLKSRT